MRVDRAKVGSASNASMALFFVPLLLLEAELMAVIIRWYCSSIYLPPLPLGQIPAAWRAWTKQMGKQSYKPKKMISLAVKFPADTY
jgi:hypothetical protein